MLELSLSPEAVAHVSARGGVLTLRRSPRHGCCGGRVEVAVAEATAPSPAARFERHDHDGITVFIDPGLGGPLHVGLDRLFGLASLYVEGAEAEM